MTERIDFLTRNRDSIAAYIKAGEAVLESRTGQPG